MISWKRMLWASALGAALLLPGPEARAHFHYFMTKAGWQAGTGIHDIRIVVRNGFSWSAYDRLSVGDVFQDLQSELELEFGDGLRFGGTGLYYRVTAIDPSNDWMEAIALDGPDGPPFIAHQYPGPGPWVASVIGCCRDEEAENCGDTEIRCSMLVDFNFPGNNSPEVTMVPLIKVPLNTVSSFKIPAADLDLDTSLRYRFATSAEYGSDCWSDQGLPGMSIDPVTGVVTWDTSLVDGNAGEQWTIQVVVEDLESTTGRLKSKVCLDVTLVLVEPEDGSAPVFDAETPCGITLPATESVPIEFPIKASDSDPNDTVSLTVAGLPPGATLTPEFPVSGNPVESTFSWTPTPDQVGVYVVQFIAEDTQGHQTLCDVTITVGVCFLIMGFSPGDWEMSPGDRLLVIPSAWFPVTMTNIPSFAIPDDPRLQDFPVYFQVYMDNPAAFPSDEVKLSNGLEVILGGEASSYGPSSGMTLWSVRPPALGSTLDLAFTID